MKQDTKIRVVILIANVMRRTEDVQKVTYATRVPRSGYQSPIYTRISPSIPHHSTRNFLTLGLCCACYYCV